MSSLACIKIFIIITFYYMDFKCNFLSFSDYVINFHFAYTYNKLIFIFKFYDIDLCVISLSIFFLNNQIFI